MALVFSSAIAYYNLIIFKKITMLCHNDSMCHQDTPLCDYDGICRRNDGMCNNHADCDSRLCGPESAGVGNLKKCIPEDTAFDEIDKLEGACKNQFGFGQSCEQLCNAYSSSKSVPDSGCNNWYCDTPPPHFGQCHPLKRNLSCDDAAKTMPCYKDDDCRSKNSKWHCDIPTWGINGVCGCST